MKISQWVVTISNNQQVIKFVRFFKLNKLVKFVYFNAFTLINKKRSLYFKDTEIKIQINSFETLRLTQVPFENEAAYEEKVLSCIRNYLHLGDVAYDVGANIGIVSIFISKFVGVDGKVIAFEPDCKNYKEFLNNLRINGCKNVVPMRIALGEEQSTGNLYFNKSMGRASISLVKTEKACFFQKSDIIPGDIIVDTNKFPLPKVVKIDVEGYEYPVIKGLKNTLSQKECRLLCCEIHPYSIYPSGITTEIILDFIKSLGFNDIKTYNRGGEIHAICCKI